MKKNNKKGFFLSEVIVVIAIVAVVIMEVFVVFSGVYSSFKESERYNTSNAMVAAENIKIYFNSVSPISTDDVTTAEPLIDLTDSEEYASEFYTNLKENLNINKIYLINPSYMNENALNKIYVSFRKYIKSIRKINKPVVVVMLNNNEFGYSKVINFQTLDCTYEGDLVQGAKFVQGQYTYKYKQEAASAATGINAWVDMDMDGWGVALTDKRSTMPATSDICSSINNIPVVSTRFMYANSSATLIDLSSFDSSNVVNMRSMFTNISAKKVVGLNTLDTSNATDMSYMFIGTEIENFDITNFNTEKVTNMFYMFNTTNYDVLDLSSFDISNVTNMAGMFRNATIKTAYAKTKADADVFNASSYRPTNLMFIANPDMAYQNDNQVVFTGSNNIDTGVKFFNSANASKDFLISFDIINNSSSQTEQASIASTINEAGAPYPGFVLKFESGKNQIDANATSTVTGTAQFTLFANNTNFRLLRHSNKLYYSVNYGAYTEIVDYSTFNSYFDVPLTFGSNINASGNPDRFYKGTLSNILVMLEK